MNLPVSALNTIQPITFYNPIRINGFPIEFRDGLIDLCLGCKTVIRDIYIMVFCYPSLLLSLPRCHKIAFELRVFNKNMTNV